LRFAGLCAARHIARLPAPFAALPVSFLQLALLASYGLPRNPLRQACQDISLLSEQAGYEQSPRTVYSGFARRLRYMANAYLKVYREGGAAVRDQIEFEDHGERILADTLSRHNGLVLAVPHTLGAVFAGIGLAAAVPACLLATVRSRSRQPVYEDFISRMGVDFIIADRSASQLHTVRACVNALRGGRVLATAVERVEHGEERSYVRMFGQSVPISTWPARLAARVRVPVVPCHIRIRDGKVRPIVAEPLLGPDPTAVMQVCLSFFERHLLANPADWGFLLDKRWRRVLREAASAPLLITRANGHD